MKLLIPALALLMIITGCGSSGDGNATDENGAPILNPKEMLAATILL